MKTIFQESIYYALFFIVFMITGCGSTPKTSNSEVLQIPFPSELLTPDYREDNTGKYMSPFTSDEVVAEWVVKAIDADIGSNLGGLIGIHLGRQLAGGIPFVGAAFGEDIGKAAGRQLALKAVGGESFIRDSSDISFNNIEDMAVYLFKYNSEHPSYVPAVKAAMVTYPELKEKYNTSIIYAKRW